MLDLELDCIESWNRNLPDYQFKLWNESNFNFSDYNFSRLAYLNRKFAFVSDVCRLHVLYHEGGIYLDTDILVLKSFDQLLKHEFFIGEEKPTVINGAVIGCKPFNPLVKGLLDYYSSLTFNKVSPQTIPIALTQFLMHRNDVKVLPSNYFYSLPYHLKHRDYLEFKTEDSIAVHLWNHSWKSEFGYLSEGKYMNSLSVFVGNIKNNPKEFFKTSYLVKYSKFFIAKIFPFLVRGK